MKPTRQNRVKPVAVAAALILVVGLAGCSKHQLGSAAPSASAPASTTVPAQVVAGQLAGRAFRVTRITDHGSEVAIASGTVPKISFTMDRLVADMGCNTIEGEYTVDGEHRLVKPMGSVSQVGCGLSDQENRIIRALRTGAALTLRGDRLTISNDDVTLDTTSVP